MVSIIVNIGRSGDTDIEALQYCLNDAQEGKKSAESVFVEACRAVEVAEARTADEEIMTAITKVHKSAQSLFLHARKTVKEVEAALEAAKNEAEENITISDDDQKPAAATATKPAQPCDKFPTDAAASKEAAGNGTKRAVPETMALMPSRQMIAERACKPKHKKPRTATVPELDWLYNLIEGERQRIRKIA